MTIATRSTCTTPDPARRAALEARGATVIVLPDTARSRVDLPALLCDLARREINELHVEAGHRLNGALVGAGLVGECLTYLAPKLIGSGAGMADFGPLSHLEQAVTLAFRSAEPVGPDLRLLARLTGRDRF